MVKLNKIYTRTGDDGSTGLGDGSRVSKTALRVEAYGTVDEANAAIGLAVCALRERGSGVDAEMVKELEVIQNDLFDLGADQCVPIAGEEKPGAALRIVPRQTGRLETDIDRWNARLAPLDSFVLPGGSEAAARLHLARTVTRRAERLAVALLAAEPAATNPETVKYLNRLSDLLFVLGRVANSDGGDDVKWTPGASRGDKGGGR